MTDLIVAAFVPLVDSAVLIAACEKGFMRSQGAELTLVREPSWASLRDHLNLGHVDCAQTLAPLPIASALGVGQVQVDTVVPFVLSRGGNAVTVSNALADALLDAVGPEGIEDASASARALAATIRRHHRPLTLGMVYPFSGHNFELRYWLATAGVHPDRDVRLVAIPPPLMVESLRAGHVDGFCVGEPWNSLAVHEGIGRIIVTKSQIFPGGVEKVLAVSRSVAEQRDKLACVIRGLDAAARWCDQPQHHAELAELLGRSEYLDLPAALIERALGGRILLSPETMRHDSNFLYFHRHEANQPRRTGALWLYAQMARWGQIKPHVDYATHAARVFRPDLYCRAIGLTEPSQTAMTPPFDGVAFDADDVAGYLRRFALCTPFIETRVQLHS